MAHKPKILKGKEYLAMTIYRHALFSYREHGTPKGNGSFRGRITTTGAEIEIEYTRYVHRTFQLNDVSLRWVWNTNGFEFGRALTPREIKKLGEVVEDALDYISTADMTSKDNWSEDDI